MKGLKKLLSAPQITELARDLALIFVSSLVTALAPLAVTPGLAYVSGGAWVATFDHAGAAVLLAIAALVSTPLTRRYGVGVPATPTPTPDVNVVSTPAVSVPEQAPST